MFENELVRVCILGPLLRAPASLVSPRNGTVSTGFESLESTKQLNCYGIVLMAISTAQSIIHSGAPLSHG